jgi:hypothetical protein
MTVSIRIVREASIDEAVVFLFGALLSPETETAALPCSDVQIT